MKRKQTCIAVNSIDGAVTAKARAKKIYRGQVDARGIPNGGRRIDPLASPGRFYVPGNGMKRGIVHFST